MLGSSGVSGEKASETVEGVLVVYERAGVGAEEDRDGKREREPPDRRWLKRDAGGGMSRGDGGLSRSPAGSRPPVVCPVGGGTARKRESGGTGSGSGCAAGALCRAVDEDEKRALKANLRMFGWDLDLCRRSRTRPGRLRVPFSAVRAVAGVAAAAAGGKAAVCGWRGSRACASACASAGGSGGEGRREAARSHKERKKERRSGCGMCAALVAGGGLVRTVTSWRERWGLHRRVASKYDPAAPLGSVVSTSGHRGRCVGT